MDVRRRTHASFNLHLAPKLRLGNALRGSSASQAATAESSQNAGKQRIQEVRSQAGAWERGDWERGAGFALFLFRAAGQTSSGTLVWACFLLFAGAAWADDSQVEFNRDVRPILSEYCFQCHGPDSAQRKAQLRLDVEADAKADRDGTPAIVPGKPALSELLARVTSDDDDLCMPPADTKRQLNAVQIATLRRWIAAGAPWQQHWSFIAPQRPEPPAVERGDWVRNPIDAFVLARLERAGLAPSPEADRATLIRRLSLDLTGLPPTPAEVDAFLDDNDPHAYARLVDRLLESSRYGERMAAVWLDAARYADTSGYQSDGPRYMWRWRDWVIEALNNNMPFDQFTIEQIAGDMLPGATLEQRIASGFNRNHRGNAEGGIVPEEYAVEYVVDRVDTTATVWLGLTLACARCHEHKFDPITQREFYRVFAYFNNVPEYGRALKEGNSPPWIKAPTREQRKELRALETQLKQAEDRFASLAGALNKAQAAWESQIATEEPIRWSPGEGLVAHYPLDDSLAAELPEAPEARFAEGEAAYADGKLRRAAQFDGRRFVDAGDVARFGYFDAFSASAWVHPQAAEGTILSRMKNTARADGWSLHLAKGRLQVNLVKRWLDDAIRVETKTLLPPNRWHHVAVTYDGSRVADGIRVYFDGVRQPINVLLDGINQTFENDEPLRIGAGNSTFRGLVDEVRIYDRALAGDEAAWLAVPESIDRIAAISPTKRSAGQAGKLRAWFLRHQAPEEIQAAWREKAALQRRRAEFVEAIPTVMVMEEMDPPRETHVLLRGQYDKPGERVTPGLPGSLPPLPEGVANNRLGFARWLVDPSNPLTARVAVNRYWQLLFGAGLVRTVEDFGTQGTPPTHPLLLDWLATEYVRNGWDTKALLKTIVTSATYRQSSRVTKELLQRDPQNRLLARGARFRLSAETIRDQALAASGLLIEKVGGPSVKPYQPPGLWKEIATYTDYEQGSGPDLYRRSMYTYWKRTVAPPGMVAFDAATRESCRVRQTRTNTPLQALTLMNDVTYVEAARVLAERVMAEVKTPEARIAQAFRRATARQPEPVELQILTAGYRAHLARFRADPEGAEKLASTGEHPRREGLDTTELAALTAVASLILNLDEVITKE